MKPSISHRLTRVASVLKQVDRLFKLASPPVLSLLQAHRGLGIALDAEDPSIRQAARRLLVLLDPLFDSVPGELEAGQPDLDDWNLEKHHVKSDKLRAYLKSVPVEGELGDKILQLFQRAVKDPGTEPDSLELLFKHISL